MPRQELAFQAPLQMAVAENAASPMGAIGAEIWSTVANKRLIWSGTAWVASGVSADEQTALANIPEAVTSSSGAADSGKLVALDGLGKIDASLLTSVEGNEVPTATLAGRTVVRIPAATLPTGTFVEQDISPAWWSTRQKLWQPAEPFGTSVPSVRSMTLTTIGSVTGPARTATLNFLEKIRRLRYSTTAAINSNGGIYEVSDAYTIANWNASSDYPEPGWMFHVRAAFSTTTATTRVAFGLSGSTSASTLLTNEPSASNFYGFGADSTFSDIRWYEANTAQGSQQIPLSGPACSKTDVTTFWEFMICRPYGTTLPYYAYRSFPDGVWTVAQATRVFTDESRILSPCLLINTGPVSTAVASFFISHWYIEKDF